MNARIESFLDKDPNVVDFLSADTALDIWTHTRA